MTVVDRATKMVHLIPCKKTTTAGEAARLYWQHVVKLHGVPRAIHTDRGAQFIGRWWREIWTLLGTKLKYGTAYHPQSQGQVERMNAVVSQTLRCLLTDVTDLSRWKDSLPTVEMVVNSLPNRSTGYSPFFLMYGYHPVLPVELLKGDESTNVETSVEVFGKNTGSLASVHVCKWKRQWRCKNVTTTRNTGIYNFLLGIWSC